MNVSATGRVAARGSETRERLLFAALKRAQRDGTGALSLATIASEAHLSKALVLYHFKDKDEVLASFVTWLNARVLDRERNALAHSTAATVLEDLWRWLHDELDQGELRVLVELSQERGTKTRQALDVSAADRQATAEDTMARVFALLELTPRLPTSMLAACERAFREGLVLAAGHQGNGNARVAFDVLWLSLLNLTR